MMIFFRTAAFILTALGVAACAAAPGGPMPPPPSFVGARIVPLVDHHQHLVSERALSPAPEPAPLIELPAELAAVLTARNQMIATGAEGDVFAPDAIVLDPVSGVWLRGERGISEIARLYTQDTRFFANGYALGEDAAVITGVIRSGDYETDELNHMIGLERDAGGAWRIASEAASLMPPREFAEAITAEHLIANLDDVGIERAVVLSVAYWFGEEETPDPGEYEEVRAENDWAVAEAAKYPDRLTALCGIPPLRDYTEREVRRCASELGVPGIKMHFRSSNVDLHEPAHLARVRRVFEVANELGLAIVVHSETDPDFGTYGRDEAEIFLNELVAAAPDVVVQIAHMWGGNEVSEGALRVFADAVSTGDARSRNLYFDLTHVEHAAGNSEEKLALIARYARQIGMDRLLYGSDASPSPDLPPSTLGWGRIRRALPLTDAEFADIADNVAPYLRDSSVVQ